MTATTYLNLSKPAFDSVTWHDDLNGNFDILDDAYHDATTDAATANTNASTALTQSTDALALANAALEHATTASDNLPTFQDFGCVMDDPTKAAWNTLKANEALQAIQSSGKRIRLYGKMYCNGIESPAACSIVGENKDKDILYLADGANAPVLTLNCEYSGTSSYNFYELRNFYVDGNKANQSAQHYGIDFVSASPGQYAVAAIGYNVLVEYCSGQGWHVGAGVNYLRLDQCGSRFNDQFQFGFGDGYDSFLSNCYANSDGKVGQCLLYFSSGGYHEFANFIGFLGNGDTDACYSIEGSVYGSLMFNGGGFDGGGRGHVNLTATGSNTQGNIKFSNVRFFGGGGLADNSYPILSFTDAVNIVQIIGCHFPRWQAPTFGPALSKRPSRILQLLGSTDRVLFANNMWDQSGTFTIASGPQAGTYSLVPYATEWTNAPEKVDLFRGNTTVIREGSGSPEGVVTANPGSQWLRSDTGNLYIKRTGTGNTGWSTAI